MVRFRMAPTTILCLGTCALWWLGMVQATIPCQQTSDCETKLRIGSECDRETGLCTNPFTNGGCLKQMKEEMNGDALLRLRNKQRVCTSQDSPEIVAKGYCDLPDPGFDYLEIRISAQNWIGAFVGTWVLQILLSEVLGIPTSIETGVKNVNGDYYDIESSLNLNGADNDWNALERSLSLEGGDCRTVEQIPDEEYKSCSHIIPEMWFSTNIQEGLDIFGYNASTNSIESPIPLGVISQEGWFVPKFTAERDPSLLSYFGLRGEDNRQKLADRFLRPTTWKQYCDEVSLSSCTIKDGVAGRPPKDESEYDRFFVDGFYTGHFRKTEKNDCNLNPTTCSGYFADFPCGWSSNAQTIAFWNEIALDSDFVERGNDFNTYQELVDTMKAANATKSDLMILWWAPDVDYHRYLGTDAELIPVTLPTVTQECLEHRISTNDRCSEDEETRRGDERGACDDPRYPLQKVIGSSVQKYTQHPSIPEEIQSPAYDVLRDFRVSGPEIGEIFELYFQRQSDSDAATENFFLREATCRWFIQNYDYIVDSTIPSGYPRVLRNTGISSTGPIHVAAIIVAALVAVVVIIAGLMTYQLRGTRVMRLAQVEFLSFLLLGLLMTSGSSVLLAISPTDSICVSIVWMTNIGYTLQLVPLVVRMAAIFHLMQAAQEMQHVEFTRKQLFSAVAIPSGVIIVFLMVWTIVDPPKQSFEYQYTTQMTDEGEHIISYRAHCASDKDFWYWSVMAWHFLLLLVATVQAIQARIALKKIVNENQTLSIMIYSHFVFMCFRYFTYFVDENFDQSELALFRSFVYSLDTGLTILIYFVPKFLHVNLKSENDTKKSENQARRNLNPLDENEPPRSETHSEREFRHLQAVSHLDDDVLEDYGRSSEFENLDKNNGGAQHGVPLTHPIALDSLLVEEHPGYDDDVLEDYGSSDFLNLDKNNGGAQHGVVPLTNQIAPDSLVEEHPGYAIDSDEDDHPGYSEF